MEVETPQQRGIIADEHPTSFPAQDQAHAQLQTDTVAAAQQSTPAAVQVVEQLSAQQPPLQHRPPIPSTGKRASRFTEVKETPEEKTLAGSRVETQEGKVVERMLDFGDKQAANDDGSVCSRFEEVSDDGHRQLDIPNEVACLCRLCQVASS